LNNPIIANCGCFAADSDEVVTMENFGKMLQWFGPFDGMEMVERIYRLVNQK